jgi:hypothetical protein
MRSVLTHWTPALLAVALFASGCESKKPAPAPVPSATAEPTAAKKSDDEEPAQPAIAAYPPGQGPPDAGPPEERVLRTGVCSLLETGYDGDNTRSTEKLIVKIKDDKIVGGTYSYRGSYALDGKVENLSIPLLEGKWLEFEMPMTTGTKEFKVRIKNDVMAFKGTAALDKENTCTWEPPPDPKDKKKKKK